MISMARYVLETGWRAVMNFFFVVGVVWSIGSLTKKVQSFDYLVPSISTVTTRPMSLSFSPTSFNRRPLVDIVVFCISFILFFSSKLRHRPRRGPREQNPKADKVFDYSPKVQPPHLLTHHRLQETSESSPSPEPLPSEKNPATHPRFSVENIPPPVEDSPPPPEKKKHEDPPTSKYSPVEQFRRSPNSKKSAGAEEAPDRRTESSPPANKSPRPLPPAAAAVVAIYPQPAPQPRRFLKRQTPIKNGASRPRQNGERDAATWTLARQAALVPSTWKPVPPFPPFRDERVSHLEEEQHIGFFAGASTTAGIPAASAPPWPGDAEDDVPEAHDSMDETWWAITASRKLKKSETWSTNRRHEPASSSEDSQMKKSETFKESSSRAEEPSSWALPQRDRSMGAEELGRRADEFIARVRNDLRLQRHESKRRDREMINRSTLWHEQYGGPLDQAIFGERKTKDRDSILF